MEKKKKKPKTKVPKKYCKWLLKKHLVLSLGLYFYLWAVQSASAHPKVDFATDAQSHMGLLQGHWVFVPLLGTSSHRGCSALAGVERCYLSVTHWGRLPSQGAVSLLSQV